jgi:NADPH2:quinone reductase
MTKAVRIHEHGGPDVLVYEELAIGKPGKGQVRIRQTAIGLNFIDVYHRTGLYPVPQLPCTLGMEGAGVVEGVGDEVSEIQVGDRVAYADMPIGAYASERVMPASLLVKLPDTISEEQAAAMMLQGMTAQYLIRSTYRVKRGETILLHAAAGGVGLILCQWAKALGVTVIGTVGSEKKAALARAHGCEHTILYKNEKFAERVREITNGKGVPVVYDSIGKDTFEGSLDCLSPRGVMVSFGNASGPVPAIEPAILAQKGSLYLTRPLLMTYTATRQELLASAGELFDVVARGSVKIEINQRYLLSEAAQAHSDLEARNTTGSTVLIPE